ncbi:hypothetical protein FHL15_006016 [Xylaria flabelliformis]|uniref:Uncharacterized protein n=1 Tax=Xylaria flabelliformis TaxID=2512241 RepID=A0A553HYV5_9PEZI|nr:hypothetical protein FHL15_006016 [Xylaria flabelliformis]
MAVPTLREKAWETTGHYYYPPPQDIDQYVSRALPQPPTRPRSYSSSIYDFEEAHSLQHTPEHLQGANAVNHGRKRPTLSWGTDKDMLATVEIPEIMTPEDLESNEYPSLVSPRPQRPDSRLLSMWANGDELVSPIPTPAEASWANHVVSPLSEGSGRLASSETGQASIRYESWLDDTSSDEEDEPDSSARNEHPFPDHAFSGAFHTQLPRTATRYSDPGSPLSPGLGWDFGEPGPDVGGCHNASGRQTAQPQIYALPTYRGDGQSHPRDSDAFRGESKISFAAHDIRAFSSNRPRAGQIQVPPPLQLREQSTVQENYVKTPFPLRSDSSSSQRSTFKADESSIKQRSRLGGFGPLRRRSAHDIREPPPGFTEILSQIDYQGAVSPSPRVKNILSKAKRGLGIVKADSEKEERQVRVANLQLVTMGSQLIQGQWSLNESSSSIYGITRGILQAATSDNVQPLAILACEQFGNTLAISQETRLKIERTVLPTPEPVSLQFLKIKVGFLKHDCAVQLGSNQAGLRFLALAAALVSSLPPFTCAQALASMLEATTTDKQYLPTTRQLTDLMSSLEGRCRLAGFADVVYGYRSVINGVSRPKGLSVYEGEPHVPDSKGLTTLIDVFRQMQRIGELEIESVVVEAFASAAWIAAFSKWSLETPPSIYLADGTPVTPQPGSRVTLIVTCKDDVNEAGCLASQMAIKVIKRFKTRSLQDLITEGLCFRNSSYRVAFGTYCSQIRDECGRHEWARKAIFAAVPLAVRLVLEHVDSSELEDESNPEDHPSIRPWTARKPSAFPEIEKVFRTMLVVLGLPPDYPSEVLASAKNFRDLPEVESYFDHASRSKHSAFSCTTFLTRTHDFNARWWTKDEGIMQPSGKMRYVNSCNAQTPTHQSLHELIKTLGFICHVILLLSLFDDPTDVFFVPPHYARDSELLKETLAILGSGVCSQKTCASTLFPDVCQLLLCEIRPTSNIIVKSGQSDCFWFSALDHPLLSTRGYLSIASCRGRIIHGRELYKEVYDEMGASSYDDAPRIEKYTLESVTHQPFSKFSLQWQIKMGPGGLFAGLSVINGENTDKVYKSYPSFTALDTLASILIVNCEHTAERSLNLFKLKQEPRTTRRLKFGEAISDPKSLSGTNIYPMGGNRGLQIYCLAVIRTSRRIPLLIIKCPVS